MPAQETYQQPKARVVNPNEFDLRTHHFDGRGRLKGKNPYRAHIQNGIVYYERPVGSGNLFYENNEPAGRVEFLEAKDVRGKIIKKKSFDHEAAHKDYTAPLQGAEKMHFELANTKAENAAILAELEAIKAENEKLKAASGAKVEAKVDLAVAQQPAVQAKQENKMPVQGSKSAPEVKQ